MGFFDNSDSAPLAEHFRHQPPQRVLVIITRRIGDVLLATPLIHSLKQAWPKAELDVLVFANTASVLADNPDISNIICIAERPGLREHIGLIKKLWRRYDLALSTLTGDRPTLYAWMAGKRRIGLLEDIPKQHWKRRFLHTWVPFDNLHTHTIAMYLALTKPLDIAPNPEVILTWNEQQAGHVRQLTPSAKPYAVLHVYPKFSYKMWHTEGWIALANWLLAHNLQVILTGSPAPDEMRYISDICAKLPAECINLSGKLDLNETACLLAQATIYIGPDTSISHIAAAMGTPSIALFGPSNPVKWGPWPKHHPSGQSPYALKGTQSVGNVTLLQGRGLKNGQDCVPCLEEGCERHINSTSDCLLQMSAQTVIEAAQKILSTSTNIQKTGAD